MAKVIGGIHDRSGSYRPKSRGYSKSSMRGAMSRFWPVKSQSSNPSDGHLPFGDTEPGNTKLSHPTQNYNVKISRPGTEHSV